MRITTLLSILMTFCFSVKSYCQETESRIIKVVKNGKEFYVEEPRISSEKSSNFKYVDKLPQFKGDLHEYINSFKSKLETSNQYTGEEIKVHFTVTENGKVVNPILLSHKDEHIKNIVYAIISNMPIWEPAIKDGVNVESPYTIDFSL